MKGSYDNVAPFYDLLSRLVFGTAILNAQIFLIDTIPANSAVLIIGGGTGQILEEISKKYVSGLQITYVDISKNMINISKKRNTGNNKTLFIHQSIFDVALKKQQFDVVITPFFFDNFSDKAAKVVFDKIDLSLKAGGLWLFADFQLSEKNNLWQKLLLKIMYFFFRLLCAIEASSLPDIDSLFKKYNYYIVSKRTFYKHFIYSVIFRKS